MITFHLTLEGSDTDFGCTTGTPVKITIESDLTWPVKEIEEFKECLAEYFCVFTNGIRTDEEEKKDAEDLDKYLKENN